MIPLRHAAHSLRRALSRKVSPDALKIGVSPRLFHPRPEGKGIQSKTLQYLEQSIAHWVMSRDVLVFMVPTVAKDGLIHPSNIRVADYARALDGLVLQGGSDVSPLSYGEEPLSQQWAGDRLRDVYEIELVHEFVEAGKPVLGICRGAQLINVAFGGTLYQDVATQVADAREHVTDEYEKHRHDIRFEPGSRLASLYRGVERPRVTSIHHQSVKALGRGLRVEAWSEPDGIVEALRGSGKGYVLGVQWHPEFHYPGQGDSLDSAPLLEEFLEAARGGP
ncbi:MAG TPA: type 1 glutamine amidotransferase [Burkholderiales bacterium]|nr:type 1 glutamine amidotransferase [Burkholderiales bacterium]